MEKFLHFGWSVLISATFFLCPPMKKKCYHSQRKSHFPSFHNIIINVIQELNEKKRKRKYCKKTTKNLNNAHFSPFCQKLANNRHFFEIFTNISFFVFSSNFLFVLIIILYTERVKVLLREKYIFNFAAL